MRIRVKQISLAVDDTASCHFVHYTGHNLEAFILAGSKQCVGRAQCGFCLGGWSCRLHAPSSRVLCEGGSSALQIPCCFASVQQGFDVRLPFGAIWLCAWERGTCRPPKYPVLRGHLHHVAGRALQKVAALNRVQRPSTTRAYHVVNRPKMKRQGKRQNSQRRRRRREPAGNPVQNHLSPRPTPQAHLLQR